MKVCKRVLAALTLLLATAALLLAIAAGVGVWVVKGPVTARATQVFGRVDAALDVADQGLDHVKASLGRAAERLEGAREEQRKLAQQPQQTGAMRRLLARTVQQRVAPDLEAANERLHTVAEAAVLVNSVLEDLGNVPLLSTSGLDLDSLTEMNRRLADVGPAAWELSRLLGEPAGQPDQEDAGTQMSRVEQTVKSIQGRIAEYEPQLAKVRQRTEELKSRTFSWITPASVIVSLASFWVALSQFSLMFHACSWWKHSGDNASLAS